MLHIGNINYLKMIKNLCDNVLRLYVNTLLFVWWISVSSGFEAKSIYVSICIHRWVNHYRYDQKKWNQPKCPPTNQSWNGSHNVHSIVFHVINNSAEICIQKGICIHMHIYILKIYYNFWLRKWSWKIHTFVKAMKPCAALIMFNP